MDWSEIWRGELLRYTDAEHTVFECTRWQSDRSVLTLIIGTITAARLAITILQSGLLT